MAGYGIMSVGAGEAHILNVCVREEYRCRGLGRKMLLYLLERARIAGMYEAFLEVRPSNTVGLAAVPFAGLRAGGHPHAATTRRRSAARMPQVLRRVLYPARSRRNAPG